MSEILDGRYEILEKIKEGGMGAIFKAHYIPRNEIRVVKTMKAHGQTDERSMNRFKREARLATSLRHPNIATVHEFFPTKDGQMAMSMEFIDGFNLTEFARLRKRLSVAEVLEIAVQTLDALAYLHSKSIVHRDISPENIMLQKVADGTFRVKLIDLGVAKEIKEEGLTETGMFVGKIRYSSPEQLGVLAKGEKIDGRSDIYSLGCVLYQFLTGQFAVNADSMQGYILGHIRNPPRSFAETDPDGIVPFAVRACVLKALEKKREDRWATAEELGQVLQRILEDVLAGRPYPNQATDENGNPWIPPAHGELHGETERLDMSAHRPKAAAPHGKPHGKQEIYDEPTSGGSEAVNMGDYSLEAPPGRETRPLPTAPRHTPPAHESFPSKGSEGQKNRKLLWLLVSAAVVILGAGGTLAYFAVPGLRPAPPPPPPGTVLFTASPWAEVSSVSDSAGKPVALAGTPFQTPVRLTLPSGRYSFHFRGPGLSPGTEMKLDVEVRASEETHVHQNLPGFDPENIVLQYAP
ncbi:MAG: Serine/threonine-protein kinase PknD [Thermoanaerobaculia bacterium]|nr:Serine/threonine-protein kinase PknD [Thermoanaerobaculia bacterium]